MVVNAASSPVRPATPGIRAVPTIQCYAPTDLTVAALSSAETSFQGVIKGRCTVGPIKVPRNANSKMAPGCGEC
jgi:hypothetical protein